MIELSNEHTCVDDILESRKVRGFYGYGKLGSVEILFDNRDLLRVEERLEQLLGKPYGFLKVRKTGENGKRTWVTKVPVIRAWRWRHRDHGWLLCDKIDIRLEGHVLVDESGVATQVISDQPARLFLNYKGSGMCWFAK